MWIERNWKLKSTHPLYFVLCLFLAEMFLKTKWSCAFLSSCGLRCLSLQLLLVLWHEFNAKSFMDCQVLPWWFRWESASNVGDPGSIPGSGRSAGEGNGNPLQYSCLENPMDRGAWWAIVHGIAKSWTWLSD